MAKINRFYLLISMLVSYRIGTAMAYEELEEPLAGWLNYVAASRYGAECYICVPVANLNPNSWESAANNWVRNSSAVQTELRETECGSTYKVAPGTRANQIYYIDSSVYALCTMNGWVEVYKEATVPNDRCNEIAYRVQFCPAHRKYQANESGPEAQQFISQISLYLGTDDMTDMEWQVCLFGESEDYCYEPTEINCGNGTYNYNTNTCECQTGYYLSMESADDTYPYGACMACPIADFWNPVYSGGKWIKGSYASASSPKNNNDDLFAACYIPGSDSYIDDIGMFSFTDSCYYGM